jgi:intracellular multiplication protein IcmJ
VALALSVHPSSWGRVAETQGKLGAKRVEGGSCRFCGLDAPDWQELFHVSGDHRDDRPGNVVSSCVLCHLSQHLDRPRIEEEACLIHAPGLSQVVINAIAREVHLAFVRRGKALPIGDLAWLEIERDLRGPYAAFKGLESLAESARDRFGTASPRELGAALLVSKRGGGSLDTGGLRLLPLGKYFRGGRDIYPGLLRGMIEAHSAR